MTKTPCPVCDDGKIPVEFDFFPYSDALDCPYCGGDRFLDPEDPHEADLLAELSSVDVASPEFQEHATRKAIQRFEQRIREPHLVNEPLADEKRFVRPAHELGGNVR